MVDMVHDFIHLHFDGLLRGYICFVMGLTLYLGHGWSKSIERKL